MRLLPRRFPKPEQADIDGARTIETNRLQLIRTDPDAKKILTTSSIDALHSRRAQDAHAAEIQEYARVKNAKGQMHLYRELFAGI